MGESKHGMEDNPMFVVTGATGHTGNVVAKALLAKGEKVRVIGRNADRLKEFVGAGAEPFTADLSDGAKVANAFAGAKAAFVMIPPNPSSPDVLGFQKRVADSIASGLRSSGVTHAVVLSSIGADKPDKTGPVVGLHYFEERLNAVDGLNVLHLRAGYFMENTLPQAGIIRTAGMAVGPLRADLKLPMIATRDIGAAAADALLSLNFREKQAHELRGQRDVTYEEVAKIIGKAIGKPDLRYTQAPDQQVRAAFIQLGMSSNMADLLLEMSGSLNSGYMRALEPRSAQNTTPISYETFVTEEFLPLYEGKSAAA
jgi:uncharacterized protein YbjT (DUF2867 family)